MPRLFVICGHGAGDPGACSGGYSEAERVRALASRMRALGGSDVQVGDTSVNWYASNWIGKGKCPKGVPVVELHMDSAAASAKGGHVIIKKGFSADAYDNALASFIKGMFPGRSEAITPRSDLANPNRAAAKGVNYRLLECCFITNQGDLERFNERMDELAAGILAAFGIGAGQPAPQEGDDMQPGDVWNYDIGEAGQSGVNNTKAWVRLGWIDKHAQEVYDEIMRTDDGGTGDGSSGGIFRRICYIDQRVREMSATVQAQAAAIEALAKSAGADPGEIAKAVSDAVTKKLESIDLSVTVGE